MEPLDLGIVRVLWRALYKRASCKPPECDLELQTQTDSVIISGTKGNVVAESKTGPIRIKDSQGAFRIKTHTATSTWTTSTVFVNVWNTIGHVSDAGAIQSGENSLRTTTGDIEVVLRGTPDPYNRCVHCSGENIMQIGVNRLTL